MRTNRMLYLEMICELFLVFHGNVYSTENIHLIQKKYVIGSIFLDVRTNKMKNNSMCSIWIAVGGNYQEFI